MQKLLTTLTLFISLTNMAQQVTFKEAFLEKWNNSRDYLIEVAKAMPEEAYDFKPTQKQRSFKEQLIHIHNNINWLDTSYFSKKEVKKDSKNKDSFNKVEIIELLKETFNKTYIDVESTPEDDLKEIVKFFAGPKSKLQIMNLLQDHVTHHRGQLLVYLNLKEITPPKFSGW